MTSTSPLMISRRVPKAVPAQHASVTATRTACAHAPPASTNIVRAVLGSRSPGVQRVKPPSGKRPMRMTVCPTRCEADGPIPIVTACTW